MSNNIIFINNPSELYNLKSRQIIQFYCKRCGKLTTYKSFKPYQIDNLSRMMCGRCKNIVYNLNHYGVEEFMKTKEFKTKSNKTKENKTPEEKALTSARRKQAWLDKTEEEIKCRSLKIFSTKLDRYGDGNYNNPEKMKETSLIRYDTMYPIQNKKIKIRLVKSFNKKYNVNSVGELLSREEFVNKSKKAKLERYGYEKFCNTSKMSKTKRNWSKERKQLMLNRLHSTNIRLYGDPYYCNREKAKRTLLNKFGCPYPIVGRLFYYGILFDSSWELAVWIYCIDNNISIIRNTDSFEYYDIYNKLHTYTPDFIIDGKYIEIKGSQYFNDDGTMYYPYNKSHRNSKKFTLGEKEFMDDLYERKHQCGINNGVEFWKENDCKKYIDYCNNKYPNWNILFRKDNPMNPSYWCFGIINPGHPQPLYYAPKYYDHSGLTPFDIDRNDKYVYMEEKGITPFDV